MQQQVVSMTEEWKKEQELVIELERENQFKHEELTNSLKINSGLKSMIEALKSDITSFKDQIDNVNQQTKHQRSRVNDETVTFGL